MRVTAAALAGLFLLTPGILAAQEAGAGGERYLLEKTDNGYLRMDARTGAMALCRERSGEFVCTPAADERRPDDPRIEALRERIAALEARVEALEGGAGEETTGLPSEEEFERTLGLMERFFRRFMDVVRGFEEEQQQEQSTDQAPAERT
ncbi:hypothetical protein [Nitratireductor sp. GCM10026969]|uniref:hypothetical protein n=1 Tax=Nitratireductor sp. GCM10026969 TaxID=3252645 RepID=UPI003623467E